MLGPIELGKLAVGISILPHVTGILIDPILPFIQDWLKVAACFQHLPTVISPSQSTLSKIALLEQLILPSTVEASRCHRQSSSANFCLVELQVAGNFSIGAGLCLPQQCTAVELARLAGALCAVPSCSAFSNALIASPWTPRFSLEAAQDLCSSLQPALCGPDDRTQFQRALSLTCVERKPLQPPDEDGYDYESPSQNSDEDDKVDEGVREELPGRSRQGELLDLRLPINPGLANPLTRLPIDLGFLGSLAGFSPDQQIVLHLPYLSVEHQFSGSRQYPAVTRSIARISWADFAALSACGTNALKDVGLLLISGHRPDGLGDWATCQLLRQNQKADYCAVKQTDLVALGRCVPSACTSTRLKRALTWASRRHCLSLVNVFPLDLCVSSHVQAGPIAQPFRDMADVGVHRNGSPSFSLKELTSFDQLLGPMAHRVLGSGSLPEAGINLAPPEKPLSASVYCSNETAPWYWFQIELWVLVSLVLCFLVILPAHAWWSLNTRRHLRPSRSEKWGTALLTFPRRTASPSRHFHLPQAAHVVLPATVFSPPSARTQPSPTPPGGCSSGVEDVRSHHGVCITSVWNCFHVQENIKAQLKTVRAIQRSNLSHLCGMRVFSIIWLVCGSTVSYTQPMPTKTHIVAANLGLMFARQISPIVAMGASLALDVFFFYSGFLVAVYGGPSLTKVLKPLLARSSVPKSIVYAKVLLMTVVHRYLRQAGVYVFVLALYGLGAKAFATFSPSPLWPVMADIIGKTCQSTWWLNVLFLNNYLPNDHSCFPWAWYLANDFQFFIISAVLLIIKFESIRAFRLLTATAIGGSIAMTVVYVVQNNLVGLESDAEFYIHPWYNVGSHLLGLTTGSLFIEGEFDRWLFKNPNAIHKDSGPPAIKGWRVIHALVATLATVIIFLTFWPGYLGSIVGGMHMAIHRPLWCLCMGWWTVSLALVHPNRRFVSSSSGGPPFPIDNAIGAAKSRYDESASPSAGTSVIDGLIALLSHRILAYCVPLIYAVYLAHPMVAMWFWALFPGELYPSRGYLIFCGVGFVVVSFAIAAALALFVELPLTRLYRLFGL